MAAHSHAAVWTCEQPRFCNWQNALTEFATVSSPGNFGGTSLAEPDTSDRPDEKQGRASGTIICSDVTMLIPDKISLR